jgi:peptidyl-Lys metalloendopeptidase
MKFHSRFIKILALVFALILSLTALTGSMFSARAASPSTIQVSLTMNQPAVGADLPVRVHVTIRNTGDAPASILKWFTPADGVQNPIFTVTRDGVAARYVGRVYKRPAPTAADYITLQPGESLEYDVNLADYYDLTITADYAIGYDATSWNLFSETPDIRAGEASHLGSNQVSARVEGRAAPSHEFPAAIQAVTGSTTFNACTTTEQSTLLSARAQASTYANQANDYLQAGLVTSLYTTWFGVYDATRYSTVRTHFTAIRSAMDTQTVGFDCTCSDSAYAYVYPNDPYNIYLCNAFWSAPMAGTDSKGGTLIHEMSHFYVVASTDDYVYGQAGAKQLAITNPNNAVKNADNHEYFAEDSTPITPSTPTSTRTSTPTRTATATRTATSIYSLTSTSTATNTPTRTVTPLFTATKTSTPTRTPTGISTPTKTAVPGGTSLIVNPVLRPSPGTVCATGWKKVGRAGYNRSNLYLTLNVTNAYDSYNSGRWTPNIPASGRYRVEAYIGHHATVRFSCPTVRTSLNTANAQYTVSHSGGNTTVAVNQSLFDSSWANLGEFYFQAGSGGYVFLNDVTGEYDLSRIVAFNVVRFTWVGP